MKKKVESRMEKAKRRKAERLRKYILRYKPDSWRLTERQDATMHEGMNAQIDYLDRRVDIYHTVVDELKDAIKKAYVVGFRHGVVSERERKGRRRVKKKAMK